MLDFIRKEQYFEWVKAYETMRSTYASANTYNLKDIQDHYAISRLAGLNNTRILEVGGSDCRVLRSFSSNNECWNAEKFEGLAGGPSRKIETDGVQNIPAYLGEFDKALPNSYFDVVFSVSVVEHVTDDKLTDFFLDIARVLKPGGLTFHAIDVYVFDEEHWSESPAQYTRQRLSQYAAIPKVTDGRLGLRHPSAIGDDPKFRCAYASNADREMLSWNKVVPDLAPMRKVAQSVSLMGEWVRL